MNRKAVTEALLDAISSCEQAISLGHDPFIIRNSAKLKDNLSLANDAFSGSWLGYHAYVYYRNFGTPDPGDHFSPEWGLMGMMSNPTSDNWRERHPTQIQAYVMRGVDVDYESRMTDLAARAQQTLEDKYAVIRTILDALYAQTKAPSLKRVEDELEKITVKVSAQDIIKALQPRGNFMSRDSTAVTQGMRVPVHVQMQAAEVARFHPFASLETVVASARKVMTFMTINDLLERNTVTPGKKIFIGHGRSPQWREFKDFIADRMKLDWEEFNRESTPGISTTERLQTMLDASCFAFLIMTAEDLHEDNTVHARENVIHEVGLFQGRLGFRRAIVLLESGCTEFSNISGLSQIRFPKGNISACYEEARKVLEREGVIPAR